MTKSPNKLISLIKKNRNESNLIECTNKLKKIYEENIRILDLKKEIHKEINSNNNII